MKHLDHLVGGHVQLAHVVCIDKIDETILPPSSDVAGAGNGKSSARSQIFIVCVQTIENVGFEVVSNGQGVTVGDEFQEALPIITWGKITGAGARVRDAVGGDHVEIVR